MNALLITKTTSAGETGLNGNINFA